MNKKEFKIKNRCDLFRQFYPKSSNSLKFANGNNFQEILKEMETESPEIYKTCSSRIKISSINELFYGWVLLNNGKIVWVDDIIDNVLYIIGSDGEIPIEIKENVQFVEYNLNDNL